MKPEEYSQQTDKMRFYSSRKICTKCKETKPQLGGKSIAKPNSSRKVWVCKTCIT